MILIALQLVVLWGAARAGGAAARRLGQPPVIGELLGGALLGPAVFGAWLPSQFEFLFSADRRAGAGLCAQAAMAAFMVCTGLETDLPRVTRAGRRAAIVAAFGIALPFACGLALGFWAPSGLIGPAADRTTFALFVGTAIAISAIPVISRILMDLGLFHTDFGTVILSAAALDDTAGWILLGLISRGRGSHLGSWLGLGALVLGAALGRVGAVARRREAIRSVVLFAAAPVFFAFAGLRVDLRGAGGWTLPLAFIAVACASKIAGCWAGARLAGMTPRDALAVGVGMNARGAMELVLASIGLSLGILNGTSYSIIVLVAIVTTVMTPPLLKRIARG